MSSAHCSMIRRLKPAAQAIFALINNTKESKGILVGGGAAVFLGHNRITKDLDINVSKFPHTHDVDKNIILDRKGSRDEMRRITYMPYAGKRSVKCDISIKRAQLVCNLHAAHTVRIPGFEGIDIASPGLLLADKIRTFSEHRRSEDKKETDLADIRFCIRAMELSGKKMDRSLVRLYTAEQWGMVSRALKQKQVYRAAKLDIIP